MLSRGGFYMKGRQGNEKMGPLEPVKFLETNNLLDVTRGNSETQPTGSHADQQQGSAARMLDNSQQWGLFCGLGSIPGLHPQVPEAPSAV